MEIVLGLDGGGTKTDAALVARSGKVMRRQHGLGVDPTTGPEWQQRLAEVAAAFGPVSAAVLGLPCHGEIPAISAQQRAVAKQYFGPCSTVLNDVAIAFAGALAEAEGVLILAGTGSMAWAQGPLGVQRVGGWGDVFGDEGSAHWIGREALGLLSQELDGRLDATGFSQGVLAQMGLAAEDLIPWTYRQANPRAAVGGVAAGVSILAAQGQPVAVALMQRAAMHLARQGLAAARQVGLPVPCPWSFAGGVMADSTVMTALRAAMAVPPLPPVLPPVGGAVLLAAKAAGWSVGPAFIATLQADLIHYSQRPIMGPNNRVTQ